MKNVRKKQLSNIINLRKRLNRYKWDFYFIFTIAYHKNRKLENLLLGRVTKVVEERFSSCFWSGIFGTKIRKITKRKRFLIVLKFYTNTISML